MEDKNDISTKDFFKRIFSGLVVFSVVSIIFANFFMPEMRGFGNTIAASLGVLFMTISTGVILPTILFFGSLMIGKKIRKKTACNIFLVCVLLSFIFFGIGGAITVDHPLLG